MKLIFPNLQNEEGKTICQLFAVDFLKFLQEKGNKVKRVDLTNMVSELEGAVDLDKSFDEYLLKKIFEEGLLSYNYTNKLIGRGKKDIAKTIIESEFTKKIFEQSGDEVVFDNIKERLFAGHIEKLQSIRKDISSYRCVQNDNEKGSVCNVCGLVAGKNEIITERISFIADKCWKPKSKRHENLAGCSRCAYVLGLISNMRFLWRVNISGKNGDSRYSVVPIFKIDTSEPIIIDKIIEYSSLFGLFRSNFRGTTSIDYILNSLKAQPIIAKIVAAREIYLMVFIQSDDSGNRTYVTQNVLGPERIQQIAEFVVFLNEYFPKLRYADRGKKLGEIPRLISDTAYIYTTKGKIAAMRRFFTEINTDFDVLLKVLGGDKDMKIEYFRNKEVIQNMNEYEWDNPLVRVSTFFVAERANEENKKKKRGDRARNFQQVINSPMALFNSIPEKEKNKTIRKFIEEITENGKSQLLGRVDRPEDFRTEFSKALNVCKPEQLKEIVRSMRMFANTYIYKKAEDKDLIITKTLEELGYSLKPWEERT